MNSLKSEKLRNSMEIKDLYLKQKELDERIFDLHGASHESTYRKRLLALLVELGELANETRCFKFWSNKNASEKDVILDEYVDGIHFILSLGIDLNAEYNMVQYDDKNTWHIDLSECFIEVFVLISKLQHEFYLENYYVVLQSYFNLGVKLGFTYQDVIDGYIKKNEVNHQRQDSNY